jgi:hypothetical protein
MQHGTLHGCRWAKRKRQLSWQPRQLELWQLLATDVRQLNENNKEYENLIRQLFIKHQEVATPPL